MTTYSYPTLSRSPSSMVVRLQSNTDRFISPTTGATQTVDRGGEHLIVSITYGSLETADRALLISFLAKLNGQQHLHVPRFGVVVDLNRVIVQRFDMIQEFGVDIAAQPAGEDVHIEDGVDRKDVIFRR